MSSSDVTRHGITGERPGREAPPMRRGRRRRGSGGERLMVDRAEFSSYYGRPVIKAPSWSAQDIAGYFFLGGLAGAGSVLAAGAQLTGRPGMARVLKTTSALAIAGSGALLVHDLGRPSRFANMLRVFKPTSPMSVGSWLLTGYAPLAGLAAVLNRAGRLPRVGAAATAGAAVVGPAIATYTAVLAADTAVPAWHDAYRELPAVFAASALTAASGAALLGSPYSETGPARAAALLATTTELALVRGMRKRLGPVAEPYEQGRGGRCMHAAEVLTGVGAAAAACSPFLPPPARRPTAAAAGLALLAASACTRFGVFHAGVASAEDPVYTVGPQRERLEERRRAAEAAAKNGGTSPGADPSVPPSGGDTAG
ncbi:NrfD/PsrC family molybdoenzyme membrane anchor subunit [Actinacidiphila acidipaludis]|uniref:Polysulfide reductase NrfD n=1 Tax=Actinacidiphila acidipaludis TaxID=2873382 RepID=A0ABS7QGF4_9ACTN|nr:NrfD/PsrC family molybdoenzyme membrane anchor subunit [Streptomyces acidipaludis]MBY8882237.1 polysulfide reductase NrfD [Streptomyces acidipaludis]